MMHVQPRVLATVAALTVIASVFGYLAAQTGESAAWAIAGTASGALVSYIGRMNGRAETQTG